MNKSNPTKTQTPKETTGPDVVQQIRSRFRLKLTAFIGALITFISAGVLIWLLGLVPFSTPPERSTVDFRVISDCPGQISASISIDAFENLIRIALEIPDIPSLVGRAAQNAQKWLFFSQCNVDVSFLSAIETAVIPRSISDDTRPDGTNSPENQKLEVNFDKNSDRHYFKITPGSAKNFMGEILIKPTAVFAWDSFGQYHMGADILIRNDTGMVDLSTSFSLPKTSMQANIIRPQPVSIGNKPNETYRFTATASPDSEFRWIDQTYFIAFDDPMKIQFREALLILASTLFGAGISALLEAFLAGGAAALFKGSRD